MADVNDINIKTIQFKRGSQAALEANLCQDKLGVLLEGEPAFEIDTGQLKIGNGVQDYSALPYVGVGGEGGLDPRIVIQNPLDGQILVYDSESKKWKNKNFADAESIIYLTEHGLTIKGYDGAHQGQMLVRDDTDGLVWTDPIKPTELADYVSRARDEAIKANQAEAAASAAANSAEVSAWQATSINVQTMNLVNNKFWWGTAEEYNALEEISSDVFYFIKDSV